MALPRDREGAGKLAVGKIKAKKTISGSLGEMLISLPRYREVLGKLAVGKIKAKKIIRRSLGEM